MEYEQGECGQCGELDKACNCDYESPEPDYPRHQY